MSFWILAPQVGLEPTTLRLTAECSAIELLRNIGVPGGAGCARREWVFIAEGLLERQARGIGAGAACAWARSERLFVAAIPKEDGVAR